MASITWSPLFPREDTYISNNTFTVLVFTVNNKNKIHSKILMLCSVTLFKQNTNFLISVLKSEHLKLVSHLNKTTTPNHDLSKVSTNTSKFNIFKSPSIASHGIT
jgi:hypothetical protein